MSKFNKAVESTIVTNLAGGVGYKESPELELVSLLLTSFVEDKFYESAGNQLNRLKVLSETIKDKKFLAQAAIYARNEFGMRSITHALAAEIVRQVKGEEWTKSAINKIVFRPDDITEILAYFKAQGYGAIPNSLKKGFRLALEKFDAYSLAKYRSENKDIKLVDIINLVHPTGKNKEIYGQLINGTLKNTQTWESKLSEAGKSEDVTEAKTEAWKNLLEGNKLGYLAAIRNIRNITEQAPECIDLLCALLVDENRILKSKVFPFTIQKAMEYSRDRRITSALSKAIDISLSNIPKLDGKTCVVLDVSGSMYGTPSEIGSLFAAALYKGLDSDIVLFSDSAKYHTPNPNDSTSTIAGAIRFSSGGTDFASSVTVMNKKYDRIIFLSDMQGWSGNDSSLANEFNKYKSNFGANPFIYSFDLNGHGTLKFPERKVACLAGFSEKVFDIMGACETDKNALINKIKTIEI